jgi:hypothetical protein
VDVLRVETASSRDSSWYILDKTKLQTGAGIPSVTRLSAALVFPKEASLQQ